MIAARRAALLFAAVLLLYGLALLFRRAPCAYLLPVIAFAAWPIWRYQADRVLFERRAVLASVASQAGRIRRWFWNGTISSVLQVFVALFLAAMLLGFLISLQPWHWAVLAIDAIALACVFDRIRNSLSREVREEHRSFAARRWPLTWLNVIGVALALMLLEYFVLDHPDTRPLAWHEVAQRAFSTAQAETACPAAGILLGFTNVIDQLAWHVAMLTFPDIPDAFTRTLSWFAFLAWSVFIVFVFTRFLLGVMAIPDAWKSVNADAPGSDRFSLGFVCTVLALAAPYYLVSARLVDIDLWPPGSAGQRTTALDPCRRLESKVDSLQATIGSQVQRARTEAQAHAAERIDAALDTAFGKAESGVDLYLDWYFSLIGEYTRLGTVFTGDAGQLMTDRLSGYLFNETNVVGLIRVASTGLEAETASRMSRAANLVEARIGETLSASACPLKGIDLAAVTDLRSDQLKASVAAALGVGAGTITTRYLAKRSVAAAAGRLAAKTTVNSAGKLLARGATKRGTSVMLAAASGTGLCSPAGPAAVICGAVAGVVTWIGIDKAMIEIDELRLREQMKKELLVGLAEQKQAIGDDLQDSHRALIDAYAVEIEATTARVFNPRRDSIK